MSKALALLLLAVAVIALGGCGWIRDYFEEDYGYEGIYPYSFIGDYYFACGEDCDELYLDEVYGGYGFYGEYGGEYGDYWGDAP